MNAVSDDIFVVSSPRHRKALTLPLRMEILEHFAVAAAVARFRKGSKKGGGGAAGGGPGVSVAEVARRMGRRPDSLYHHVRLLAKAGLLVPAATRKSGKRDERLYRAVSATIAIPCDPDESASVNAAVATVNATFRLALREMRAALKSKSAEQAGPLRNFIARRVPARLSPSALREVNKHIDAILDITEKESLRIAIAKSSRADAMPVSITIALMPMPARVIAADSDE